MNVPRDSKSYERFVKAAGHNFVHLSNLERPGSGSKWNLTDILTFRVLYNRHEDDFPPILKPLRSVADKRLKSKAFRAIVGLVEKQVWKGTPHDELQRIGKDFGSFLSYLAEALETPWTIKEVEVSARPRRDIPQAEYKQESDDEEDLFDFEASADDQEEVIAESSDDSDRSHEDQDTLDRQNKSETVTSALIMEFLKSLAKCTRNSDDRKFRLEWTTDQDTFEFEVPTRAGLVSKNDGGLVHRSLDPYGNWARMTPLSCYCSIEAKAAHFANGKRIVVYAQEVSQIIGMIHQREENSRNSGSGTHLAKKHRIVPLISISQHFVSLIIAQYDSEYYHFLRTGDDANEPFLKFAECGKYKLANHHQLIQFSRLVVALMGFLENAGPHPG